MNAHIITRNVSKLHNLNGYRHIFSTLTQEIKEEKPRTLFSSALAHEVRNPLNNINLAIEMLTSTILDNDQKIYVDIIRRAAFRINGLVTELLTPCELGEMPSENQSIQQLLDDVLAMAEDRIRLKNISVRKDYTTIDCRIWINKQQMKIALTNIIINAIDAVALDSGQLKVVTRSINGQCVIEIEDNGVGISKTNLANIFKPFFTNKQGGMGLGLSTTLEILHANHAQVDVKSKVGQGTRFLLSFERIQDLIK
jgi:signal transduction histidine kinase